MTKTGPSQQRRGVLGAVLVVPAIVTSLVMAVSAADDNGASAPLDHQRRSALLAEADALPRMRSLLISVGDQLVEEHYYHGASQERPANLKSASKSIISLLVGIAIDQGYLSGVDQPIAQFFPTYFSDRLDAGKAEITLEDLLTMRSGLETTSNRNYGRFVQSSNWVHHVLSRPMVDRPGGAANLQHGKYAPPVGDHHRSQWDVDARIWTALPGGTARLSAPGLASGSPGRLFRRQRDAAQTP